MIRVNRVIYDYPGLRALDRVSFDIPRASITALIGPNGAGKTTLMRCISGIDQPMQGDIRVGGIDVLRHPRRARRTIGYLPDQFGLYDQLTLRQSLTYRALAMGMRGAKAEAAILRAARRLDIADRLEMQAGQLSRGLRQRLAIAETILHEPPVLVLDEPASGLDPEARDSLSGVLRRLRADGMTLLVSSHILSELEDYSTHLLILRRGRIVDYRPIDQASALIGSGRAAAILTLAHPLETLSRAIAAHDPAIEVEVVDGRTARLILPEDPETHAALLRTLILAGVPVSGFAPETSAGRLKEAYMARLFGAAEELSIEQLTAGAEAA